MNYKCTPEVCWAGRNRSPASHFVSFDMYVEDKNVKISHSRNAVSTEANRLEHRHSCRLPNKVVRCINYWWANPATEQHLISLFFTERFGQIDAGKMTDEFKGIYLQKGYSCLPVQILLHPKEQCAPTSDIWQILKVKPTNCTSELALIWQKVSTSISWKKYFLKAKRLQVTAWREASKVE